MSSEWRGAECWQAKASSTRREVQKWLQKCLIQTEPAVEEPEPAHFQNWLPDWFDLWAPTFSPVLCLETTYITYTFVYTYIFNPNPDPNPNTSPLTCVCYRQKTTTTLDHCVYLLSLTTLLVCTKIYCFLCLYIEIHQHLLQFLLLLLSRCVSMGVSQCHSQAWHANYIHFSDCVNKLTSLRRFYAKNVFLKRKINRMFYGGDNFYILMALTITVMILIWVFDHIWDPVFFIRTEIWSLMAPTCLINVIPVYDYNVLFAQVSVKNQIKLQ